MTKARNIDNPNQSLEMEELVVALERASFKSDNEKERKQQLESDKTALTTEVGGCKKLIKTLMKSETQLKAKVEELQDKLIMHQEKAESKLVTKLEAFNEKLDDIGQGLKESLLGTLKESLTQELEKNNKKTEEKLEEATKTYAAALTNTNENNYVQQTPSTIKSIITQARNEEKSEEQDRNQRSTNIILHGVDDSIAESNVKEHDVKTITHFLKVVDGSVRFKSITRLGQQETNKNRPIKVVLHNAKDKDKVMRNLSKLKGNESFNGIRVTEDYTPEERKLIKSWVDKAKQKNETEPKDSKIVWTVRGNPKKGLRLWWLRKNPAAGHY